VCSSDLTQGKPMSDHPTTPSKSETRHALQAEPSTEHKGDGMLHHSAPTPSAMSRLSHEMDSMRAETSASMNDALSSAEHYGRERIASLRAGARDWQNRAENIGASTTSFVRHRPVQSLLLAAASGAALMGLVSLLSRARRR